VLQVCDIGSAAADRGLQKEFEAIIAAVIGGTLLTGGYGSVIGTFFGAAMLGMVQLGIVDAQWDSNWTYTFQGGILFLAVVLNLVVRNRAQRGR
jgi:simple sugar transport system permease protein